MRKKNYLRLAIAFFIICLAAGFWSLRLIGVFSKDELLVKAQACGNCAAYEVIKGSSKVAAQVQEPADSVDATQVNIVGEPNPFASDFTKTFDYFLVSGKVTGLQRASNSGAIYPVISVTTWQHFDPVKEWIGIILTVLFLIISLRYFIKFRKANQPDATKISLETHAPPPAKKS
ncbi:MAG: hypothetical protein QM764_01880 [Chitinophagaceae bacterium]